jgi:hypothetical protein
MTTSRAGSCRPAYPNGFMLGLDLPGPRGDGPASRFLYGNNACAFLQVTALVDPTLQHKNQAEVLVDGAEIIVRPVSTRNA